MDLIVEQLLSIFVDSPISEMMILRLIEAEEEVGVVWILRMLEDLFLALQLDLSEVLKMKDLTNKQMNYNNVPIWDIPINQFWYLVYMFYNNDPFLVIVWLVYHVVY